MRARELEGLNYKSKPDVFMVTRSAGGSSPPSDRLAKPMSAFVVRGEALMPTEAVDERHARWRYVHFGASGIVALVALAHLAVTPFVYSGWDPDTVWFVGTGMGLLLLGVLNLLHLVEVTHWAADRLLRWANVTFAVFSVAACVAVPEAQTLLFAVALVVQAVAGLQTVARA